MSSVDASDDTYLSYFSCASVYQSCWRVRSTLPCSMGIGPPDEIVDPDLAVTRGKHRGIQMLTIGYPGRCSEVPLGGSRSIRYRAGLLCRNLPKESPPHLTHAETHPQ